MARQMFSSSELGMGNHFFSKIEESDHWWRSVRDFRPMVLFWCPDLSVRPLPIGGFNERQSYLKDNLWEVVTPSGKRVCFSLTEGGAWRLALAMIMFHFNRERERVK